MSIHPFGRVLLAEIVSIGRQQLTDHVQPRDETERAIVRALGEISWDEAVEAIQQYRQEIECVDIAATTP